MRILFASDIFSGCTWYRHVIPAQAAEKAGHEVRLRIGGFSKDDLEWCEVLNVQRLYQPAALQAVKDARAQGKLTVCDLDDDLWTIGPHNSAYKHWKQHGQAAIALIKAVDRCTTTGPALASTLSRWNRDVRIVPNALADDWVHAWETHRGTVIGWAGSHSHGMDITSVRDAMFQVLDTTDARMEMCGLAYNHLKVTPLPTVDIERYHMVLSRFDIGIAPIVDTRFNRAKSDLKCLEYAGLGIPFVASNVGPYKSVPVGYLATTKHEWVDGLTRLVTDASLRHEMGVQAREWAETRRISRVLPDWVEAWG